MLAIRRGEAENILYFLIEVQPEHALSILQRHVLRQSGDWTRQLEMAIDDAWKRLLNSSIQEKSLNEAALDTEAIASPQSYCCCSPASCRHQIRSCAPAASLRSSDETGKLAGA